MNDTFRNYVFGRSFNLNLSEKHIEALTSMCRGEPQWDHGLTAVKSGLMRRGLIEWDLSRDSPQDRPRLIVTKAGLLVYQLLVEAGEHAALEEKRARTLEMEAELHAQEWEERFGNVQIKLKDRFRKDIEEAGHA